MKPSLPLIVAALLPAAACAQIYKFEVTLDGAQEFPGPGDPDGTGFATLYIDSTSLEITWEITVSDIQLPVTADHIHNGLAGASGPVRVDFMGMLTGGPLFDVDLASVLADPTAYYVNVHNAEYPAGAVRGQLGEAILVPEASTWAAGAAVLGLGLMGAWRRQTARNS